jgi:hypothetical protein
VERDYEDIDEIDEQTDGELRALVRDRLDEQIGFDPADVDVNVRSGTVILSGRVGTEEELRIVEHVVTDVVGIKRVTNNIFVDPIRRAESPIAIDEHLADEEMREGLLLGDRPSNEDPEAEHLREDMRAELFGTTDPSKATEDGIPWNPPDQPTPEGLSGMDAEPSELRDDL